MKPIVYLFILAVFTGCSKDVVEPGRATTMDAEIERIAKANIVFGNAPGMTIGILKGGKTTIYNFGVQNLSTGKPFNEYTIGEIGSVTKPMTAILAAQLINEGKLSLAAPANQYLPANLQLPSKDGKQITVKHLLNHTSGLPENPDDLESNPNRSAQPFDYPESRLADFLKRMSLKTVPGTTAAYSNVGIALAGVIVRQLTGERVTNRLDSQIFKPLGMTATYCNNAETPTANVAQGYLGRKPYDFFTLSEVFEPVGAVKSNMHDMLAYLKFVTDPPQNALGAAFNLTRQPTFALDSGNEKDYHNPRVGLAWGIVDNANSEPVYSHTGGTYGFSTFFAFNAQRKTGVVIISNGGVTSRVTSIGYSIMTVLDK